MDIADLHIHSRYSRATSRECVPEGLELWGRKKGIGLLGTGDFTHPAWRQELRERLLPQGNGLYRLRPELQLPWRGSGESPGFVLSGEISSIYKKNGRTRKVHSLILLPSLEAAEELSHKLEAIGNLHSDGRPILGLDCRDLLEITLEACPDAVFIPAHIWTPHFSLFGAFSGFDTLQECFGDLSPYIHALETGLSSDPPMNWRLSALDGYTLVSNSDAHSPGRLGREANLLEGGLSYEGLSRAIQTGEGFLGTIEFFPEEGKYHYDGHRACGVCLSPLQTEAQGALCPICGRKLTIGVEHRVEQLADREPGFRPKHARPFQSLAPLPEVISASTGLSAAKAQARYEELLLTLGPEFHILRDVPLEEIGRAAGPCLEEGLRRLREGRVERIPGYDGEYGRIRLLDQGEMDALNGQIRLFGAEAPKAAPAPKQREAVPVPLSQESLPEREVLNPEQEAAIRSPSRIAAVLAGPGTGKTRTLSERAAWLVLERGVKPSRIAAVTFTNQAAEELRARLARSLGSRRAGSVFAGTFHRLCLELLKEAGRPVRLAGEPLSLELAAETVRSLGLDMSPGQLLQEISRRKNGAEAELSPEAYQDYCRRLSEREAMDLDDLLLEALALCEAGGAPRRFLHLLADEFQDVSPLQYRLLLAWTGVQGNLFAIGDPDQAIYGFRGADGDCFRRLAETYPDRGLYLLRKNYRSTPEILRAAKGALSPKESRGLEAIRPKGAPVRLIRSESPLSEGIFAAKEIGRMVGGVDMLASDGSPSDWPLRSFSDIALLFRTRRQGALLEQCLRKEGIPCVIAGRDSFLEDRTVRGTVDFFRFLCRPEDTLPLESALELLWNVPADLRRSAAALLGEGLSPEALDRAEETLPFPWLGEWFRLARVFLPAVLKGKPWQLLETWVKEAGLPLTEPMEKLRNAAVFHKRMDSFLDGAVLGQEWDFQRSAQGRRYSSGAVTLATFHGSKGLEFPVVFLCGLNRSLIPLEGADPAEERRLLYVGMTRAREELLLLTGPDPSPFLADPALWTEERSRPAAQGTQLSLF